MSKKDLTSVDSGSQGKGKAAGSFPKRREETEEELDARWQAERRPVTGENDLSSVHDILQSQKRSFVDYVLIFLGYVLPIITVIVASAFFLTR